MLSLNKIFSHASDPKQGGPDQCDEDILTSTGVESPAACPVGFFCQEFSEPTPCPPGTFTIETDLLSENQCSNCKEGYFCATKGNVDETGDGLCADGFSCSAASDQNSAYDDVCPKGSVNYILPHIYNNHIHDYGRVLIGWKLRDELTRMNDSRLRGA